MSCTPSNPGMQTPCPTCPPGEPGESIAEIIPGTGGSFSVIGNKGTNFGAFVAPKGDKGDKGDDGDKGDKGDRGVGIASVVPGANGSFTIVDSDGNTIGTFVAPTGDKGDKGDAGDKGDKGDAGVGTAGRGIASVIPGPNGTFTLTGTDGQSLGTFIAPKGDKGDHGDKGDQGLGFLGATLDANGNLILTRSDGAQINAGPLPRLPFTYTATATGLQMCIGTGCGKECQEITWPEICAGLKSINCELGTDPAPVTCTTPTVSAALSPTSLTQGTAYTGSITMANATSATVSGLPTGLTAAALSGNTIAVTGTPNASGSFAVTVNATNACSGGTASSATGLAAGSVSVASSGGGSVACTTPTIKNTVSPATATKDTAYTGTIKLSNATSATVSGLPAGITASALSGDTITLSGTPTASGAVTLTVDATNNCGGGNTTSTASGLAGGTLTVAAAVTNSFDLSDYGGAVTGVCGCQILSHTFTASGTATIPDFVMQANTIGSSSTACADGSDQALPIQPTVSPAPGTVLTNGQTFSVSTSVHFIGDGVNNGPFACEVMVGGVSHVFQLTSDCPVGNA